MAHLVFPTHEPTLKKPKEPFFANAHKTTLTEIKLTLHNILLNFALSN